MQLVSARLSLRGTTLRHPHIMAQIFDLNFDLYKLIKKRLKREL